MCVSFDRRGGIGSFSIVTVSAEAAKRSRLQIAGILVHEATHVWQQVRKTIGEELPSVEFEAYAMQAIAQGLLNAYEKTRGKIFR